MNKFECQLKSHGQLQLEFHARYSPDLNPIEKMWSKIKAYLRKAKARTLDALQEAIKNALQTITNSDAIGWFKSCGYTNSQY